MVNTESVYSRVYDAARKKLEDRSPEELVRLYVDNAFSLAELDKPEEVSGEERDAVQACIAACLDEHDCGPNSNPREFRSLVERVCGAPSGDG